MKLVHLVYIHGFQGNDTTFQSFPTDLQQHLSAQIPAHLDVKIRSSLYPTYKSVKPISFATKNFLEWLATQPPGPVIVIGHSMGGLLAAEAATDPSNNRPGSKPHRIIGMIAFDTPYLGMHPHVVVTGIASLFPKDEENGKKKKTMGEMNDNSQVNVVDGKVTEDWAAFKQDLNDRPQLKTFASSQSHTSQGSPSPSTSQSNRPPPLPPRRSPAPPLPPRSPPSVVRSPEPEPFIDRTLSFLTSATNDPRVKWVMKHSDAPFSASSRWVVERFQFGSCMFDPSGLKERYSRLVSWQGGVWINYWTQTVPKIQQGAIASGSADKEGQKSQEILINDDASLASSVTGLSIDSLPLSPLSSSQSPQISDPPSPPPLNISTEVLAGPDITKEEQKRAKDQEKERKRAEKERQKELKRQRKQREAEAKAASKAEKDKGKVKPGRHFIVLPTGLGQVLGGAERWEKVLIEGVDDEVAAHCGLFIREQNWDYDGLVDRVGQRILGWCEKL